MARKQKKKKTTLSAAEKRANQIKKQHKRFAQDLFRQAGFSRLAAAAEKEFTYNGFKSDFDDVFLLENVLVLAEYTTVSEGEVSAHLKKKSVLYGEINKSPSSFVSFFRENFSSINSEFSPIYQDSQFQVRIVYASLNPLSHTAKNQISGVVYLDYNFLRYFQNVASTVRGSARYELLHFLGVAPGQFGPSILSPATGSGAVYAGSVLPTAHSHLPKGFKVVSFYVDAEALLSRSYVLRRDGWRSESNVYQRMISRRKVEAIRKHLLDGKGVFVNNVIVTLAPSTKLLDEKDDTIDVSKITKTTPGRVRLPNDFNSIGIIDGQHRIFSYYEGGSQEDKMAVLRKQQNLLVTGIMFPPSLSDSERTRFEARLFLEINSNQTNAKSSLKQEIGLLLRPYFADSIAKKVVSKLNETGPLRNQFEKYFYDKGKLKTTTIVSYGLRPLVRIDGDESLFQLWNGNKQGIIEEKDDAALEEYIDFAAKEINIFIGAARVNISAERWTADRSVQTRVLNTTFVNGLIACLRKCVAYGKIMNFDGYKKCLNGLNKFDFSVYTSSHYNLMGEELFQKYFNKNSNKGS